MHPIGRQDKTIVQVRQGTNPLAASRVLHRSVKSYILIMLYSAFRWRSVTHDVTVPCIYVPLLAILLSFVSLPYDLAGQSAYTSVNSFHKILKSRPCRPLVSSLVGSPRPNSPRRPSVETISFAAVTRNAGGQQ